MSPQKTDYKCTGSITLYGETANGKQIEHTHSFTYVISATNETDALDTVNLYAHNGAEIEAGWPSEYWLDSDISNVIITEVTEHDRLAAMPRSVAPVLPGFEGAIR